MAAEMGFDAVEILEMQMHRKDNAYLQSLKRQALVAGLDLCGLSTHQASSRPRPRRGKNNIAHHHRQHRVGLRAGHPHGPGEHRPLGHEQGFRRADEEPRHRAAAARLHR